MNEKLEQELLSSIEVVKEYVTKGANFASEQAPLVIEELIRFNLYYNGVYMLVAILLAVGSVLSVRKVINLEKSDNHELAPVFVFGSVFSAIFFLIFLSLSLKDFIMCLTAPRLFVIQYLKDLL